MPRVSKEVEENTALHPTLSKIIFYLAENPENSNGLEKSQIGISQSVIYRQLIRLEKENFIKKSDLKRGAFKLNVNKIISEFLKYFYDNYSQGIDKFQNNNLSIARDEFDELNYAKNELREIDKEKFTSDPYVQDFFIDVLCVMKREFNKNKKITLLECFSYIVRILQHIDRDYLLGYIYNNLRSDTEDYSILEDFYHFVKLGSTDPYIVDLTFKIGFIDKDELAKKLMEEMERRL